jgi:hypothetical protein
MKVNVAMSIVKNLAGIFPNKISEEVRSLIFTVEDCLGREWEILM